MFLQIRIPLFCQFLPGNKTQGRGIDAVAFARGFRSVVEYMSKMGITMQAAYLGTGVDQLEVGTGGNIVRAYGPGKTWPAGLGVILIPG